jgi:hypothetical protein
MGDLLNELSKLNPLKNKITFKNGSVDWQIDPELNFTPEVLNDFLKVFKNFGASKMRLKFNKQFEKDVNLTVIVDGKAEVFAKGFDEDNFFFEIDFEKKIENFKDADVRININFKGRAFDFASPAGEKDLRLELGLKIKY